MRKGGERHAAVTRLPFPILQRSPVSGLRQTKKQKEVGVKRVETLVSTLLPRRGARHAPAVRRRRIPSLRFSEKTPRPLGANTLTQFEYPAQPVLKKTAVRIGRIADATRAPWKAGGF